MKGAATSRKHGAWGKQAQNRRTLQAFVRKALWHLRNIAGAPKPRLRAALRIRASPELVTPELATPELVTPELVTPELVTSSQRGP